MLIKELLRYCEKYSTPPSPLLRELERETHLKTMAPQMMSGPLQGQFLRLFSLMMRPKRILEIGTFTGYSTLCLAEGLPENGLIYTIEADEEVVYLAQKYFRKTGMEEKIKLLTGDARSLVPELEETFDLVFIDGKKSDYADYFDMTLEKIRAGGIILADNVLWSGKVIRAERDSDTEALHAFNEKVNADPRVENLILPLRDGLTIIVKK